MYKFIFRQWKNRKATAALIIIGFMIGSFVMSLGISASKESFEYISDQTGGNPDQLDIFLECGSVWNQKVVENIVEKISSYGEVTILSMSSQKLDQYDETCPIVPVLFQKESDWHIPLLEGRYFTVEDMKHPEKNIVLGKYIAEKYNVKLGDTVKIEGGGYHVIGICGRATRETSWEYAIFMCWEDYLEVYKNCFQNQEEGNAITIHLQQGRDKFLENAEEYIHEAEQKGIWIDYREIEDVDTSSLRNSLILTIVSTILIFTIAVINIVHLMLYWIMERKREIGIMKALGADNGTIVKSVLLEVLVMASLGCLSAILIQFIAMLAVAESTVSTLITFRVTWENLLYAMLVSLFFGVVSAIIPAWMTMRFEPVSVISNQ